MTEIESQEHEKKKTWLKRYRKNQALLDRLEEKLEKIDAKLYRLRSPSYSGMPRGGTAVTVEELLSDKVEMEERINKKAQEGKRIKKEILAKLDELEDPRHVEVLELFCIERKGFPEISDETGYTVRHVIRLYSEAIHLLSIK